MSENCNRKWLQMITDESTKNLVEEHKGLYIQTINKTAPNGETESIEMKGVDGVKSTSSTYKPFDLEIEMLFRGIDKQDADLFLFKLNSLFSLRKPYYIRHSDLPDIKYFVEPTPELDYEYVTPRDYNITVTFSCLKGYSESYRTTNQMSLSDGLWQFEEGLKADDEIKYVFTDWGYRIFNGSNDTINPFHHSLTIKLNLDAPEGFTLKNKTTGDTFEYYEPLKRNTGFKIQDIYPIINLSENVGRYSNFEWITLAPGWNDIEITGRNLSYVKSEWIFNFIFK